MGLFPDYFKQVKEAQELNKIVCGNCYNYDYDGYVFVDELGERQFKAFFGTGDGTRHILAGGGKLFKQMDKRGC